MSATLRDPLAGRELDGRYLVRARIARGGMATVYLAVDRRLDREIALKVLHAHLADDDQFTDRFIREARAAARLSHPNVVQVFDQGSDGDLLFLAMEYLRGRTLREVLVERRALTPREALTVIEPVLDALAAAHRLGIVHRDVKPENVILTDDGRVKVADFGLARAATTDTSTGVLIGTVAYMAPELVLHGTADTRGDVYAAGIMLFEMLTGSQPFGGDVPIQVAYRHVNDEVPAPSTLVPGLPPALDHVVTAATARSPDDRPGDAAHLLEIVRSAHVGLTPTQLDTRAVLPPAPPHRPTSAGDPTEIVEAPLRAPGAMSSSSSGPTGSGPVGAGPVGSSQHTRVLGDLADALSPTTNGPFPATNPMNPADRADRADPGEADGREEFEPSPEDEELSALLRRRRRVGRWALIGVVVLALVLAGTGWYFAAGPGSYITTPRVSGLSVAQAESELSRAGLHAGTKGVFDPTAASGVVVRTDPAGGHDVRKNGTVTLEVSQGPQIVTVPAVTGQQQSAATAALTAAHLVVGTVRQVYDDAPSGQVLSQTPTSGQRVDNGSGVALSVSRGPAPVTVPDLTGMTQTQAESALQQVRLGVIYGPKVNSATVPSGSVVSQTPSSGTLVPGQSVTVVLSQGPVMVPVPDVVSMQVGAATTALSKSGFQVRVVKVFGGFFGTVRFESPSAGSSAPQGSTVTITVI